MHFKKIIFTVCLTTLPLASFALFCPTNFNQIDLGDSIDKVKEVCGKPTMESTKKEEIAVPQEWSYFVSQTVSMGGSQSAQGTLKTAIALDKDGKVINISVNGIGVGATNICGSAIRLGDQKELVKNACGEPSFITKQTPSGDTPKTKEITEFTYSTSSPNKLIFTDGKLTERQ